MKITVITNYWINSNGGGVKTYLTNLIDEFKKNSNLCIDVIFQEGEDNDNYHVLGNRVLFPMKSFYILSKIKPNVICSQGPWYCLLGAVLYRLLHTDSKLIHTFHTEPSNKLPFFGKMFFQFLLNRCDCVTFVSKSLKEKNEEILGLRFKKTEIIYAGAKIPKEITDKEVCSFYSRFNIKEDSIILLAHGLTSFKYKAEGAKLLIKSIKIVKVKYPNIVLILTKEGPFSNQLKNFSKSESLSENIIFTGNLDNPNIPLKICNLYTHTPLIEGGVSLSILEAMAMGKPILATSIGGIPEAIDNGVNGILVQPDPDTIAQKIIYLLENEEFAFKLGQNAQKTVKEKFDWKTSVDTFLKLC
ncbi:glycosyltransferase family 4 protein [Methanosarcina mazei]|uniref:Glycosyltransferase n=1 Tax=Methanosarcina mazei S-6 TaxID=213585 RepID=A0A0E3RD19_METMZ|nr:glycosyltransferase family 4 protein [Methanosarcina mazei]AKB63327.1 Glycosyltransferase [Methanosarcina mazei S-6]